MGGYEAYVWSSYGLFVLLLVLDFLAPRRRERAALRKLALRQQREASKEAR